VLQGLLAISACSAFIFAKRRRDQRGLTSPSSEKSIPRGDQRRGFDDLRRQPRAVSPSSLATAAALAALSVVSGLNQGHRDPPLGQYRACRSRTHGA